MTIIADVEREKCKTKRSEVLHFRVEESRKRFNTAPLGAPIRMSEANSLWVQGLPWGLIPFTAHMRVGALLCAETALIGFLFLGGIGAPGIAEAACSSTSGGLQDPLCSQNIYDFIRKVLEAFVYISIPFLSFFIVYAGFKFVIAQGNSTKLKEAQNNFQFLIIGAILILGAWALAELIKNTLGQISG